MSPTHSRIAWILVACCTVVPSISKATTVQVSGHVTDAQTHLPIANATVEISEVFLGPPFDASTPTDSTGYFQLGVPPGLAHFNVSAAGYITQNQTAVQVEANPVTQDFAMVLPASISGKIEAATTGNPALANVTVSLLDANSQTTIAGTSSANDGSYSFQGVNPGTYGICVIDPTDIYIDSCYSGKDIPADGTITLNAINLTAGSNLSGIDLPLRVGAPLSGTLSDRYFKTPIANTQILMTLYSTAQKQVASLVITTDANGGYVIPGLAAGSYFLEAGQSFAPNQANSAYSYQLYGGGECATATATCPFVTAPLVNVPTTGASGVNFSLFPGYVVTGRVTDAGSGQGIAGVTINTCDILNFMIYGISGTATTDANGNYVVAHAIGASTYIAAINAPGYLGAIWPSTFTNSSDSCVGSEKSAAQTLSFTTPDEVLAGINFGLQSGAAISGTVTASDIPGAPIAASLNLYSTNGQTAQWIATLRSDANGYFQTPGVPPGTYYIAAFYDSGADCQMYSAATCGMWDPTKPLSMDFSAATPVPLTSGQAHTGVGLQLKGDVFHDGFGN